MPMLAVTTFGSAPPSASGSAIALDHALGRRCRLVLAADVLEQHGELVSAEARDCVDLARRALEPARHRAQQLIPLLVAERVVDGLEAVEVDEQQRRTGRHAPGAAERLVGDLVERRPVGEPGQLVVVGEVAQALGPVAALRDVLGDGEAGLHRALVVAHGSEGDPVVAVAVLGGVVDVVPLAAQRGARPLLELLPRVLPAARPPADGR